MRKKMIVWACAMSLLASCQQNEWVSGTDGEGKMSLRASVSDPALSRTVTDAGDASTEFEQGDEIGFFMPGADTPVKWTLTGDGWQSEVPLMWENKVDEFEFCAYYPHPEGAVTRTSIPMPDLASQRGDFSELGTYDFLAARCTAGYASNAGAVSFVGDYAFKHVYSLLTITIKKDKSEEDVRINRAVMKGAGMFSRTEYHFGENQEADGLELAEAPSVDELVLEYDEPVEVADETGYSLTLVCNPSALSEDSEFSIAYVRDGISYTASTNKLGKEFQAGVYNKYTLKLTKEGLVVIGQDVVGWNENVIPDIAVEETPDEL